MILHAVGDSHSRLLWDVCGRDRTHWLGPMTMYRVTRDRFAGLQAARECLDVHGKQAERDWIRTVPAGAVLLWCYGEIDVRCHLAERVAASGDSVVDILAWDFVGVVRDFALRTSTTQAVLSVTPAVNSYNPAYPCRGTLEERRRITALLNGALRVRCQEAGVAFADIFHQVADQAGGIQRGLTSDGLHLSPAAAPLVMPALQLALGEAHVA